MVTVLWQSLADNSDCFYGRGLCYMYYQDNKRALYDFSTAIRIETKKEDKDKLALYYLSAGQAN